MKPVHQTKFSLFYSNGKRLTYGNCLIACVASMVELPIDEVPNVYTFYGLSENKEINKNMWFQVMNLWLNNKFNKNLNYHEINDVTEEEYVIMRGLSMRNKPHTCIYKYSNGIFEPYFDPHQTSEYLSRCDYFLTIK